MRSRSPPGIVTTDPANAPEGAFRMTWKGRAALGVELSERVVVTWIAMTGDGLPRLARHYVPEGAC